jgi:hypothetical protein
VKSAFKKKLIEDLNALIDDAEEFLKKAAMLKLQEGIAPLQKKAEESVKVSNGGLADKEERVSLRPRRSSMLVRTPSGSTPVRRHKVRA